jgi:hypothetical protein
MPAGWQHRNRLPTPYNPWPEAFPGAASARNPLHVRAYRANKEHVRVVVPFEIHRRTVWLLLLLIIIPYGGFWQTVTKIGRVSGTTTGHNAPTVIPFFSRRCLSVLRQALTRISNTVSHSKCSKECAPNSASDLATDRCGEPRIAGDMVAASEGRSVAQRFATPFYKSD